MGILERAGFQNRVCPFCFTVVSLMFVGINILVDKQILRRSLTYVRWYHILVDKQILR